MSGRETSASLWQGAVAGLLLVSLGGIGCSSPSPRGEGLGVQQQALSTTTARTLGFEALSDWSALWSGPALALSSLHTEGNSSLELRGGGWMLVQSRELAREGEAPNVVGYDVRIPPSPANPWWHGSTALWLDAPSVGIWGQFVGHVDLTGFPLGHFRRVEFTLPADLTTKLNGPYTDLRLRVVVNASPNDPSAYQLDRFTFGPGQATCSPVSDDNPCTDDVCAGGVPQSQPRPAGTPCDTNTTVCDGVGSCNAAAQCELAPAPIVDDGNPCTSDACDPISGVQHLPIAAGVSCESDADVCNGIARCDGAGTCQPSAPPAVDDGNPCTIDACDSQLGVSHVPATQGTNCDADANVCDGAATCDANGVCQAQPAPSIDDGNPCTVDSCDPRTGPTHEPAANDTACNDGNACTLSDSCQGGVCVPGAPKACPAADQCHDTGICDSATGSCSAVPKPNGAGCSDGNACTIGDACQSGSCLPGPPKSCAALDDCHDVGACDSETGACSSPVKPDGASCDDDTVCNGRESCADGVCVASVMPVVDDGNPCTADACDPSGGVTHTPVAAGSGCNDDDVCNGHETCDGSGACLAGVPPSLSDGSPCTIDACDPIAGVTHTPAAAGSSCSDADVCNGEEQCNAAGSCIQGPPLAIDDGDVCTEDECDPATGVSHLPIAGCGQVHGPGEAFETRASILGRLRRVDDSIVTAFTLSVFDDRLDTPARNDVWVEIEGDGRFRARLSDFPESTPEGTAPQHVLVKIEGDFPTIVRSLHLRPGDAAALGDLRVLDRDPKVTLIGPAGGVASNSAETMELVVPPGALASPTPIIITAIPTRDLFPTPLPGTTLTTYGVELEPSGTTFAAPATLRIQNTLNLPSTMKIPAGSVDPVHGDWQHEGFAVWDGSRFAAEISHFSPYDFNPGAIGELVAIVEDGIDPHKAKKKECVGSSVGVANGALKQAFELPSYSASGRDYFVQFLYDSSLSGSVTAGVSASDGAGVPGASRPLMVTLGGPKVRFACVPPGSAGSNGSCSSGGAPSCIVGGVLAPTKVNRRLFGLGSDVSSSEDLPATAEDTSLVSVDVPSDEKGQPSRSAYHPFSVSTAVATGGGSCAAGGMGFGVAAPGPAPQAGFAQGSVARTELEQGALFDFPSHQLVIHRRGSPYGSGWSVAQHRNLYRAPDRASAELVHASGERESFRPYPLVQLLGTAITAGTGAMAVDTVTGDVFTARKGGPSGISQLDLSNGTLSSVAPSASFGGGDCFDLKVARVNGARRFLIATTTAIWEVDETGAERRLFGLASGAAHEPAVASVGRFAYFTEDRVNTPLGYSDARLIRRIDLTDPQRTVESISAAEPGDLRLDPRGEAFAKDFLFLHPRGLAPSPRGGLYVADDRRHAVYELLPDENGDVGPDSPVVRILGSGSDTAVTGLGRRLPALEMPVRSPGSLSVAPDGTLFVTTARSLINLGAMLSYHPGEKTAGWVAFDRDSAMRSVEIPLRDSSVAPVSATTVITTYAGTFLRLTTGLTSQYQPTRALSFTETGALVLDSQADRIEEYRWTNAAKTEANLVSERLRSGEPIYSVIYRDRDRIEAIEDPSGGRTLFSYDARGLLEEVVDPAGRVTRLSIDDDGNLREVIEPTSETRRFDYQDYRMTSTIYPSGEVSTYEYHEDGTLKKATKPGGAVTQIESALAAGPKYGQDGRLLLESTMIDERGISHRIEVNAEGAVISDSFEADGVAYTVRNVLATSLLGTNSFESLPNRLQRFEATTINGVQVGPTLVWDASGRLVQQVVPGLSGASSTTIVKDTYNGAGRLSMTAFAASNLQWVYGYDSSGHANEAFDFYPYGPTVSRRSTLSGFRAADGQPTQLTTSRGLTSTFEYDSNGRLELLSDTVGRTLRVEYDAAGNPTLTDDAAAIELRAFDAANRLTSSTDAEGNVTTFGYADPGCACSHTGRLTSLATPDLPSGTSWSFGYDNAGRLVSTAHPDGTATQAEWSTTGELVSAQDQAGRWTRFTHDQLGRVATVTDPAGRVGRFTYSVPNAGIWTGPTLYAQSADGSSAPADLTAPLRDGDYQLGVNALQPASHRDHVSFYRDATFELAHWLEYDVSGRLSSRMDRTGIPLAAITVGPTTGGSAGSGIAPYLDEGYSYDINSPLPLVAGVESNDKYISSRYDHASTQRDSNFDITSQTHLGASANSAPLRVHGQSFVHDAAGRATNTRYTLASGVEEEYFDEELVPPDWRYRPVGTSAGLSTTYAANGRVEGTFNGRFSERFSYDERGYLQTRTLRYREGESVTADLWEGTFQYFYDAVGRNILLVYPEGHERRQEFDSVGRLTSRCYAYTDGTPERCYTATYDAVGNPKVLTDPELRQEIEYDTLDRLTEVRRYVPASASTPAHVERYAYNALGGFTVFDGEPIDHQRPRLDGNGAASAGMRATLNGTPVPLDGGGRVTALGDRTFRYFGIEHRLQAIARNSGETRFSYDAFGRPAGRGDFSSSPTQRDSALGYLYNADSPNIALTVDDTRTPDRKFELNGLYHQINGPSRGWIYDGVDHPIWAIDALAAHYYELDITGNVRRLHLQQTWLAFAPATNPDLGGYAYTAFGRTLSQAEPGGVAPPAYLNLVNPYKWQARWTINGGTLYDFRSRIWSTDLGSFLQPDEYAFLSHGGTLWSWPGQNPFRWRDPSGRIGFDGASTDRAIGAGQDWGDAAFRRGLNQGAAAGAAFNAVGAAAIIGGGGASVSMGVTGVLTRLMGSNSAILRWLGLAGTAGSQVVKGCADAEAGVGAAARALPQIAKASNREMLGQAVGHVKNLSGNAAQKADLFQQLGAQITKLSGGSWTAARGVGTEGSHVFLGGAGEALVINPAGQLFRGSLQTGGVSIAGPGRYALDFAKLTGL